MRKICQGDILSVERVAMPVLVVSKDFFNEAEQVIACPVVKNAMPDPLHIPISSDGTECFVLCEQMKFLDLRARGFSKKSDISIEDIINITDAIQSIFDYYPYG